MGTSVAGSELGEAEERLIPLVAANGERGV